MAPPVPYGHYAKDYVGDAHKCLACLLGQCTNLLHGHGLLDGHGLGHGNGDGSNGDGGSGGHGGFFHNGGSGCGDPGCFGGINCGLFGHHNNGGFANGAPGAAGYAATIDGPSAQAAAVASPQGSCGFSGCNVYGKHTHLANFGHHGNSGFCGDPGCGIGFAHSHGNGDGNGMGGGQGGCGFCGGKGCSHCLAGLAGLGSKLHGKLASLASPLTGPRVKWFVGAGGPVPLTPGYVPYIVTTRSPREFFAFPPMNPNDP